MASVSVNRAININTSNLRAYGMLPLKGEQQGKKSVSRKFAYSREFQIKN